MLYSGLGKSYIGEVYGLMLRVGCERLFFVGRLLTVKQCLLVWLHLVLSFNGK